MELEYNTVGIVLSGENKEPGILTDAQRRLFEVINIACISCIISVFGITANVINITVFVKQGFANTVNISFLGMAISDLCCLITLLWITLCMNPLVIRSGVPWTPTEFEYLTGAWPHIISGRITSYITVYITAERCLCVLAPLKIKQIVTPPRTAVTVCLIYLLNVLTLLPEYLTTYLDWRFSPHLNRTILSITYTSNREAVAGLTFFINSITGVVSFMAVVVFTVILATKLKETSKWRQEITSGSGETGTMACREKKMVKMIVVIATVLIASYTPGTLFALTSFVVPEFDVRKRFVNLGIAMWSIGFVLQSLNSSVNIFFYYKMSSKYREIFDQLFSIPLNTLTRKISRKRRQETK